MGRSSTARRSAFRKQKKTFSLSREAVRFLEHTRKEKQKSTSEIIEELIREKQLAAERERIAQNIRTYYDSIADEERQENTRWGNFAESQFPSE